MGHNKSFIEWFAGSYVKDNLGAPLVVYRGEHGESDLTLHTRLPSISFGSRDAACTYAMDPNDCDDRAHAPRVIGAYLSIKRPIFNNEDDPFVEIGWLMDALGEEHGARLAIKFEEAIQYTGNWIENFDPLYGDVAQVVREAPERLRELYFDAFRYLDDPEEVALLKEYGYDGAAHLGNGETALEMEYRVFDLPQIRSAYSPGLALDALSLREREQYAPRSPNKMSLGM